MKLNGFVGKGSGKLGSSVFAISGGEQIVREYNPRVANPNTDAQVAQRAKMKLMSQLAAALAPGLAFKKIGLVSARNQFVAKNIGICTFIDEGAHVELTDLKLTAGSQPFNTLEQGAATQTTTSVSVKGEMPSEIKKVVFVVCKNVNDDKIQVSQVKVVDVVEGTAPSVALTGERGETDLVFAYGWKPASSSNAAYYSEIGANIPDDDARVGAAINTLMQTGVFTDTSSILPEFAQE